MYSPQWGKQGIDPQVFNKKSISRKITHPQSLFKLNLYVDIVQRNTVIMSRTAVHHNGFMKTPTSYRFYNLNSTEAKKCADLACWLKLPQD